MPTASSGGAPVSARNLDLGGEALCSTVDCAGVDPAVMAAAVLAVTSIILLTLATFVHISRGVSLVNAEQKRTGAERDAFQRFATRVEDLDASSARAGQSQRGEATLVRTSLEDPLLGEAREAYRETVMSVAHFEEEYDESLAANMAAEFGEDVATAVVAGSRLTPELQRELVRRSREAAAQRRTLMRTLSGEEESLVAARDRLAEVERELEPLDDGRRRAASYDDLIDRWYRLQELETDTERILADRQRELRDRSPGGNGEDDLSFYDYVYKPLSVNFPVLADGLGVLDRVRVAERRVVDGLTSRV